MPIVLYIFLALVVLVLISGLYTFVVACVRRKELPWLVEEEMRKTSYVKYVEYIQFGDRFMKEHNAQKVTIHSFDGLKLSALWVPAKNPKGTIIFAHGYRSCRLVDFSLAFPFYHEYGLNILVPEQRAHGESEGKIVTFGVKESRDMQSWIAYHNSTFGNIPVMLSGLSMGASTMLFLADKELPSNVKGVIADCGFTSPWEIIKTVFYRVIHLPATPVLWAAEFFARIIGGFSLREMDTRQILKNSKLPVFLVHGEEDGFVPYEMTKQAYAACTSEKELLIVPGADHGVSFLTDKPRYTAMLQQFLSKCMEAPYELRDHKEL